MAPIKAFVLSVCLFWVSFIACQATQTTSSEQQAVVESGAKVDTNSEVEAGARDDIYELYLDKAKRICSNRRTLVESMDEMLQLIGFINRSELKCSTYLAALYELDPILKIKRDNLCGNKSIDLIRDYHFRFIQPFRRSNRKPTKGEPLPRDLVKEQLFPEPRKYTVEVDDYNHSLIAPIAVRHFFLKLVLQISKHCKQTMVANLLADTGELLEDEHRDMMKLFEKDQVYGRVLGDEYDGLDFDTVLYIPELDGVKKGVQPESKERELPTDGSKDAALYKIVRSCQMRFKPIYDKLIMPIVRLSKLGYDYLNSDAFEHDHATFLNSGRLNVWLAIVHTCEIFSKTKLITQSEHPRVLLDEMGQEQVFASNSSLQIKFMPIEYEPRLKGPIENKLMIASSRELRVELGRKYGYDGAGLGGLLRKSSNFFKRMLAKLDFNRFAHFRRHSTRYASMISFLSMCVNLYTAGSNMAALGR